MAEIVKAPRGSKLHCKGWVQEAAMRMLLNNLDPEVAGRPQDLVVYGGIGKAAQNWESYHQIVAALNADLKPMPKAACIPEYELRLQLAGGVVQKLGYSCQGTSFLRGDQPAWREQDAQPPAAFDRLMSDLLAAPVPKP